MNNKLKLFLASYILVFSTTLHANATGEQVIAGQANFQRIGNNLHITQGSQRVIINWQDFSNNVGELTEFIQPNSSAAALNRVVSGNLSKLLGELKANGQIYLVNPNGIVVGADARINTQSFIASTLDVSNSEFMNGGDMNFIGDSGASIVNLGKIETQGGDVFLIARYVDNSGTIDADGHIGLAGGNDVLLKASGDDRIAVRVTDKDGRVDQKGLVEATKIELRTAGNNPYALAINHEGISRATSAVNKEGRIILFAEGGTTKADGTIDASAPESGDGGFVETSGTHVQIAETTQVDTSAANGETGTWLIDPEEIEINSTSTIAGASLITASTIETNLTSNNVTITSNNALAGNGNVTVNESITETSTTNNLTLNAGTGGSVNVNQSINIGGDISLNAGDGAVGANGTGDAGQGGTGGSGGGINVNAALTSAAGSIDLAAGHGGAGGHGAAAITDRRGGAGGSGNFGGSVTVNASLSATQGSITVTAGNSGNGGAGGNGRAGGEGGGASLAGNVFINAVDLTADGDIHVTAGSGGAGASAGNRSTNEQENPLDGSSGGVGGPGGSVQIINSNLMTTAGSIDIRAGGGGNGANGGWGNRAAGSSAPSAGTGPAPIFDGGDGGNGGDGGAAGFVTLSGGSIQSGDAVNIAAGAGGSGGGGSIGGDGGFASDAVSLNPFLSNGGKGGDAGRGGVGKNGGSITAGTTIDAEGNVTLVAGSAGSGGEGGFFAGAGGLAGGSLSPGNGGNGGAGGDSGAGGSVTVNNAILSQDGAIQLTAGNGGNGGRGSREAGRGHAGSSHGVGGNGADGGDGGVVTLNAEVNTVNGSASLSSGTAGGGGLGTTSLVSVPGTNGIAGASGAVDVDANLSAGTSVTITSAADISGTGTISAVDINLAANSLNAVIGSVAQAIQTNASGTITASANNGTGGIYLANQGDLFIEGGSLDAGAGDIELTANDGQITTGALILNIAGGNATLTTTEGADNFTVADRNIQIGSGGINAANTNITLTSADDILINGDVTAASLTATTGDGRNSNYATFNLTGQRGGNLTISGDITTTAGAIDLSSGAGGAGLNVLNDFSFGGSGGAGGHITIVGDLSAVAGGITMNTGQGGDGGISTGIGRWGGSGGSGGNITIVGNVDASNTIQLTTAGGGKGNTGGTAVGDIPSLGAGVGGNGGHGGSISVTGDMASTASGLVASAGNGNSGGIGGAGEMATSAHGGTGGNGGIGGSIQVIGDLTTVLDIVLAAGNGGDGNRGGIGGSALNNGMVAETGGNGGNGGSGNFGGSISYDGTINTQQAFTVTAGAGGSGGAGALGGNATGVGYGGSGGIGGVGGDAGDVTMTDSVRASGNITLLTSAAGAGGVGGNGGNGNLNNITRGGRGGDGNQGGNGGDVSLNAPLYSLTGNVSVTASNSASGGAGGVGGLGDSGKGSDGTPGSAGNQGVISGADINLQADAGNVTLTGPVNPDAGAGLILRAGLATGILTISDPADLGLSGAGNLYLSAAALNLTHNLQTEDGDITLHAGSGDLTISSGRSITSTGTGNIMLATDGDFHNDSGSNSPLSVNTGRFVVYSTRPDSNRNDIGTDTNAITHDFVQYGTVFDLANPIPVALPAGSGFAYSVQPVLTGVTVTVNDQTIDYGEMINGSGFSLDSSAPGSYEVGGLAITAAEFELTSPGSITAGDITLSLDAAVGLSTAGFAEAGNYSGGLEAVFTSGNSNGISLGGTGDLTVNTIDLNVSLSADDKVYDATTDAVLTIGSDDRVAGDILTIDPGTSAFTDKNVGTGKTVTVAGTALTGADASNYNMVITNGGALTADITQADLVVNGAIAQNKVYDQGIATTITGAAVTALLTDTVNLSLDSAEFENKNVGNNKAVTASYSISGTDAGNYNLVQPTGLTADITARTLNATLTANDKTYDATTTAIGLFNDDRIAGDVLAISGALNFDTKDVGADKTVTATGLSLSGTDGSNYVLASTTANDLADITPAALTIRANNDSKVFDGIAYIGGNGVNYAGFVGGENQSLLNGVLNYGGSSQGAASPGSYAIAPSGLSATNYAINFINGALTIRQASVGGSNSNGGGNGNNNNGPSSTFTTFQATNNNDVNTPDNNLPLNFNTGFRFTGGGPANNAVFPLRTGTGGGSVPPSLSHSSSFDGS